MRLSQLFARILAPLLNPEEVRLVRNAERSRSVLPDAEHLRLAADWLLNAQRAAGGGGYARLYCLVRRRWDQAYIETTGYIIPTMLQAADHVSDERYRDSACRAARWLLSVQNPDGSFNDIDKGVSMVFDTGQCLLGLNTLARTTGDEAYYAAACKAGDWLVAQQEPDGSWVRHSYLGRKHTYYTRVAAALIELADLTRKPRYAEAGQRFLDWALTQQTPNGYFNHANFANGEPPYLHTMAYVLEGLLHAWTFTRSAPMLQAALRYAERLKQINIGRDTILYSQYDSEFRAVEKTFCTTGLAQWAGVCLTLYDITDDAVYLESASKTLHFLKRNQIRHGANLTGGFTASIPFYGAYVPGMLTNWTNKFFIDALMAHQRHSLSPEPKGELLSVQR